MTILQTKKKEGKNNEPFDDDSLKEKTKKLNNKEHSMEKVWKKNKRRKE